LSNVSFRPKQSGRSDGSFESSAFEPLISFPGLDGVAIDVVEEATTSLRGGSLRTSGSLFER